MENKGNNNNGNNNNNNSGGNNRNGMTFMIFILAALLVLFLTSLLNSCAKNATNKEITYSEFISMVENDKVAEVVFTSNRIKIKPKNTNKLYQINYYTAELNDETLLPLLKEHGVKFGGTVEDVSSVILWNMVSYILPLVLVWVLLYFLIFRKIGGGGMMGVGKSTAKVYVEKSTGVTFKDVAGQDEAKESLQEVVDFLHNPKKYTEIGAKLPKGALLVGPPGTGKTLLAKAVAGEANVPFFSLAGSDFVEMFVGVGASRVRDLFKEAQKQAPCIIFIDEIDAIGKSRDTRYGGNDEREQTLNQLLAEMDGFDTSKGLLILAATNRPEVLDKALLRPGRFDRRIIVDKPDLKGRVETLKVHAKNVLMDDTVDLDAIALATSGAVGSDLANMINEAAINAVKHGRKYVNQGDLFESVEVVIAGKEKKDRIMGPKEKKMVAYHEVGHALVTALQKDAEPVQKITIVPRTMGALGYTMQVPEEEKFLMTKNELIAHLVTYMGGRAAEEIVFESVTTGASNDIEQATKMARAMVTQYGMSEKFGLMGLVTVENKYLDGRANLNCGEDTAAQIDQEVMRILKESYDEATRLLRENRKILDEISQYLYEHETITGKEFMKIFRKLKGIPEPEEKTEAEKAAEKFTAEEAFEVNNLEEPLRVNPLDMPRERKAGAVRLEEEERHRQEKANTLRQILQRQLPGEANIYGRELSDDSRMVNTIDSKEIRDTQMINTIDGKESRDSHTVAPAVSDETKDSHTVAPIVGDKTRDSQTLHSINDKENTDVPTRDTVDSKERTDAQIENDLEQEQPEYSQEIKAFETDMPQEIKEGLKARILNEIEEQAVEVNSPADNPVEADSPMEEKQIIPQADQDKKEEAPEEVLAGVNSLQKSIPGNMASDTMPEEEKVLILHAVSSQEQTESDTLSATNSVDGAEALTHKVFQEESILPSKEIVQKGLILSTKEAALDGLIALAKESMREQEALRAQQAKEIQRLRETLFQEPEPILPETDLEELAISEEIPQELAPEDGEGYLDKLLKEM